MVRKGFKMKLYPDMAEEYEKRHNELWPEMKEMIHEYGGRNYTIFLDRETNMTLFGYQEGLPKYLFNSVVVTLVAVVFSVVVCTLA